MKKLTALLLALCLVLGLAACGSKSADETAPAEDANTTADATDTAQEGNAAPAEDTSDTAQAEDAAADYSTLKTVKPGVLTVGTSPDFAPYEFYLVADDGSLQLAGFDIALAQALADHMGLELEIVPLNFDSILLELQTGNIDLGIAGLGATPERVENFDFSIVYHETGNCLVVLDANKDVYTSLESLAGKQVGAQNGSIQMERAQELASGSQIVGLTKATDVINEVLNGKLDAAVVETPVAECYQKTYPNLYITDVQLNESVDGNSVAVAKGNTELLDAVNAIIEELLADGTMNQYIADATDQASGNIYEGLESDYQG